ncbi:MAG: glycosyltransferase family 2 protein [Gilvibacter sp.]
MNVKKSYPKITVVTPNFNQGAFLERAILSVLDQNYPNLEYIIIDGGSTDNSVAIIEKYSEHLHYWESAKDQGMYFAINKGFDQSSGEIMCWINSDDVLWKGSLHAVANIFNSDKNLSWLQGYPSVIDEQGALLYQRPPVGSEAHFYSYQFVNDFEFIQQESTFWSRSLWEKAGGRLNTSYALAADFDLWMRFFEHEKLYCTKQQLAAFRKREGQKSGDSAAYLKEAKLIVAKAIAAKSWFARLQLKLANKQSDSKHKSVNWIEDL